MLLLPAILTGICWGTTFAAFYPPDCPQHCECDGPLVTCSGGIIPQLDERLTQFEMQNANPAIRRLTSSMTQKLEDLISLQITSVGLESIEGGALARITRLENLEINGNQLETLTSAIFEKCTQLSDLNLENNEIKIIENSTFSSLGALENLSLAHNSILSLPNYLPPTIKSLNIEGNQIKEIEDYSFNELTSLNMCNNQIISTDAVKTEMKQLVELCLGGPKFELKPSTININTFPVLGNLRLVGSDQNRLTITALVQENILNMTSKSLHSLTIESCKLRNLDFFNKPNNHLQTMKALNITSPMPNRSRMQMIRIPSVEIFDVSGSPMLAMLFINEPTTVSLTELKVLRLSRCGITHLPESVLQDKAPGVTKLDLSHNPLRCTCFGLSWIKKYVFDGKLSLIMEENTVCAFPNHLKGIPLLTATMCPITEPDPNITIEVTTTKPDINLTAVVTSPATTDIMFSTTELGAMFNHSTMTSNFEPDTTEVSPTEPGRHVNSTDTITDLDTSDTNTLTVTIIVLVLLTIMLSIATGVGLHYYRRRILHINSS